MKHRSTSVASIVVISALSAVTLVAGRAEAQVCAQVEVQNVRPNLGILMVAAYADEASFNKKPVAAVQMPAGAETMKFPLCGLTGSAVSLTLYQDLNSNGKLDNNVFGIPSEPWGASGKPLPMTAPTWGPTTVPLDGSTIVVKLSR